MINSSDISVAARFILFILFITTLLLNNVLGYHDQFDNKRFHCWPVEGANKFNSFDCKYMTLQWIKTPPSTVIQNSEFIVKYELIVEEDKFYNWMIENKWLDIAEGNVTKAKEFCATDCGDPNSADEENCCVHHINIHSCPIAAVSELGDICGPWIQPNGTMFVHTPSMATKIEPWTTKVLLENVGMNTIIAHIRIGSIQLALGHNMNVYPMANCGDDYCDIRTETCDTCKVDCCPGLKLEILIVIIVISSLLVLALILIPAVWYYQKQKFLYDESWVIPWEKIKPATGYKGFGSVKSIASTMLSQVSLQNGGTQPVIHGQIFTETGIYEGKFVSIKKIYKTAFQLSRNVRIEVRNLRALDHSNLSRFVGIVVDLDHFAIITEYCNKGSLNDVLLNDEIPLNWGFRLSFAQDICRGMEYIHNHKMYHGRLKSSNCIIDDRWVCKVTDHGLPNIRQADSDPEMGDQFSTIREKRINRMNRRISGLLVRKDLNQAHDNYLVLEEKQSGIVPDIPVSLERGEKTNRVYRPPEANMDETQIFQPTTDVYSFSIILVEIGGRTEISPPEEEVYDPSWRPELPDFEDFEEDPDNALPEANKYIDLIRRCWGDRPHDRPSFTEIKKELHHINPNKENPVDMMMKLMEKYSKHLESLVTERTKELIEEKKKTDRLLYAMLPQSVAEDLKQGKPVSATKYAGSTIFFSDIVGFTNLSSSSTPMEVVELLNQMYTAFDSIIDEHDVYKVETIGDAYMVVSGVPKINGLKHAEEIATMAIKIVCFSRGFRVPHRPKQIINIRAGMHSGPVVTGVVGLKMPRFCLFGDTVNMASRMESTGEALRIQASPDTYEILKDHPEFQFEYRGEVEIKGKGKKKTYWLNGRNDLNVTHCLTPATHRRIFKGANIPLPNPLTPEPVETDRKILPPIETKVPGNPKLQLSPMTLPKPQKGPLSPLCSPHLTNGHQLPPPNNGYNLSSYTDSLPHFDDVTTPLTRGVPERDSTTSRDRLIYPDI